MINSILKEAKWIGKTAKEFPTQEALNQYLEDHPDANRSLHSVKKQKSDVTKKHPLQKKVNDKKYDLFQKMNLEEMGLKSADAETDFEDTDTWKNEHTAKTKNGSSIIGTPHLSDETDEYIKEKVIPNVLTKADEAIKNGKQVVFLAEGQTRGFEGSEQRMIADELDKKFKGKISHDSFDDGMNLYDEKSFAFHAGLKFTNGDKDKLKAYNAIFDMGQDTWIDNEYFENEHQKKLFKEISGVDLNSLETGKTEEGTVQIHAKGKIQDKLRDLAFPEDSGKEETEVSRFAKFFNDLRDKNLISKMKNVEKSGKVAIIVPGASHAYSLKPIIDKM